MGLEDIKPISVSIEGESLISRLLIAVLDEMGEVDDLTVLLKPVRKGAREVLAKVHDGETVYCIKKMFEQGDILHQDGRYSLNPTLRDTYFKVGGTCSED